VTIKTLIALIMVTLTGCATIVSKSNYEVEIISQDPNATITVMNGEEQVFRGVSPAIANLPAKKGYFSRAKYEIIYTKGEYQKVTDLRAGFDPWYLGNILIGGLIGMLIIDPLTGAMWQLPSKVTDEQQND
jgi:uncharacterized protein YceK